MNPDDILHNVAKKLYPCDYNLNHHCLIHLKNDKFVRDICLKFKYIDPCLVVEYIVKIFENKLIKSE